MVTNGMRTKDTIYKQLHEITKLFTLIKLQKEAEKHKSSSGGSDNHR